MRIKITLFTTILLILTFAAGAYAQADDSLIGVVTATRNEANEIISATFEAEAYDDNDEIISISYNIELEEVGKELAANHDGEEVKVTGTISKDADGNKTILVSSYEADYQEEPVYEDEESIIDEESFYEVPEEE
jgi:hypothetical protein